MTVEQETYHSWARIFISRPSNCWPLSPYINLISKNDKPCPINYTNMHPAMTGGDSSTICSSIGDLKFDVSIKGHLNFNDFMSTTIRGHCWKTKLYTPFTQYTLYACAAVNLLVILGTTVTSAYSKARILYWQRLMKKAMKAKKELKKKDDDKTEVQSNVKDDQEEEK